VQTNEITYAYANNMASRCSLINFN